MPNGNPDLLSKTQAVKFLGLDEKIFENYFRSAGEIKCQERENGRGRFYFEKSELEKWLADHKWRTINLTLQDYALCLDFALAQHFRGYVLSDWGTARQREFGQKITNWVKGQLGEVAVKRFFKEKFNVEVELDFSIYDEIVPQDIIGVVENGTSRVPKIGIAIKSSKPKSAYLVLSENEVILPERKSDVYIFCRPDIPDDHLLRIAKEPVISLVHNKPHFASYKDKIPSFEDIPCEIAGYCWADELEKVTSIPGQEFDNGFRYVKQTGKLHRSEEDWKTLAAKL
jgi:hypothetical protein